MYNWRPWSIRRFFGLDLKTNVIEVKDGNSLAAENVYQGDDGVAQKRPGHETMFASDEASGVQIDEIGAVVLNGTKYWFKFADGKFKYSTSRTGAVTVISPSPAISTSNQIWFAVLDSKLFFVDGTNVLRYFDGANIKVSTIPERPTVALTTGGAGTGYDYTYTVDNGLGESPACGTLLVNKGSAESVVVTGNYGPATVIAGDVVRIYSKATSIAAASKLVATYTWTGADVTAGSATIPTVAISDLQPQLYTELGIAINKSAISGLTGLTEHYGRLVGWKGNRVYNSKSTNPHSWPDDTAQKEAFVYGFGIGDGEDITCCISYRESLFVLKPTHVAVFGGVGPDDTGGNAYSFRRLEVNRRGCIAGKSAAVIGEKDKNFLVYLSRQGWMATDGTTPTEVGEKIQPEILGKSDAVLSKSVAIHDTTLGLYLCAVGSPGDRDVWVFDVRESGGVVVGWWKWIGIDAKCLFWDGDRMLYGDYDGVCASQRITGTSQDFSDVRHEHILPGAINTVAETITVSDQYVTGERLTIRTSGTIPVGLTANASYYAIVVNSTTIKLASNSANALAGIALNIASQGIGSHTLVRSVAIDGFYTTNWIHFGAPTDIKKVSKPAFILNTKAQSVNVDVYAAYDWTNRFELVGTITLGSSNLWGELLWGAFVWGEGATATPKNVSIPRRKFRAIRYKIQNSEINQDFNIQGISQRFVVLRNRGNDA